MENGVALPHARTAGVTELVAAVGISIDGCDGSHIFVLSLCPKRAERPYLQFIARIATIVAAEENRQAIMNSNSPAELREIFLGRKG
jgi:mannitol/fructose-specific phosphotransferase system IIA component (Ntr-type)